VLGILWERVMRKMHGGVFGGVYGERYCGVF